MHELSWAESVLQTVDTAARKGAFAQVRSPYLWVPALAGVEVDALRFALQSLAPHALPADAGT